MDNLDELFDGMPEPDAGLDFVIDESKRLIAVPEEGVVLGEAGNGTLKFWAASKPTQTLTLSVMLLVPDVQLKG